MTVRLLNADQGIIPPAVNVLGFADREIDRFALVMAVSDHPAIMVDYVPTVVRLIEIDMEGGVCAGPACWLCHQRPPKLPPTMRFAVFLLVATARSANLVPPHTGSWGHADLPSRLQRGGYFGSA